MDSDCRTNTPSKAKILVVDDMPLNIRLLREMLSKDEYEVLHADRGEDALRIVDREHPDVILLDVMMPLMDGYEVCARLKASPEWREIPVILITALNETTDYVQAMESGADDFMSKPFNQTVLRARVRSYIQTHRTRMELRRQEQFRYDLLRMVAHDLNNHMGAVMGYIELLISRELPSALKPRVGKAMRSAEEAARLLHNFMGIEKMESGRLDVCQVDVDVHALVRRSVDAREVVWQDRGLNVRINLPEDSLCRADESLLTRVFQNLLDNAIRYSPPNSPIDITSRTESSCVLLSIANYGNAIPSEALEQIFDRFYQVKSRPEHSRCGTGLGLAFCRMAVEHMGGSIYATSPVPGRDDGVEFTVRLAMPVVAAVGHSAVPQTCSNTSGTYDRFLTPPSISADQASGS